MLWTPGVHGPGIAVAGRHGAFLARSTLLQAGASRRRGCLAPGLFVLDAHTSRWLISPAGSLSTTPPVENGCLQYLPGSHRWPLLPITGLAGDMEAIRTVLSPEQMAVFDRPAAIELKKRRGIVPSSADGPRLLRQRHRPAAPGHGHQHLSRWDALRQRPMPQRDIPVVPAGQPMRGQFFPLLFDPAGRV